MILPENAEFDYESEMTHPCEKIFKKLPRNQQVDIKEKISNICKNPFEGYKFQDSCMKGLLHDHVGSRSSNVLVVWSIDEPNKRIFIEAVGSHNNVQDLQNRRKRIGYGFAT